MSLRTIISVKISRQRFCFDEKCLPCFIELAPVSASSSGSRKAAVASPIFQKRRFFSSRQIGGPQFVEAVGVALALLAGRN